MEVRGETRKLGEVVWAKIVGYPWWPAQVLTFVTQVVLNDSQANSHKAKVLFFGDNSQYRSVVL